jgi:hypothetical protein
MSVLWIAFGMILRVDIGVSHAVSGARMIRRRMPGPLHQPHSAEFFERNTTPVCNRTWRLKSAPAFAAVLITQHAKPSFHIPAQSVRAEQPMPTLVAGFHRLLVRYCSPDNLVNLLHSLDLRPDNSHLASQINQSWRYPQDCQYFMTQ